MSNAAQPVNHIKLLFILLFMMICFASVVMYFGIIQPQQKAKTAKNIEINGFYLPTSKEVSPFQLTDNTGKPFSDQSLKGQWTMMFFGFTNCGMVCPTTLAALSEMYQKLQKELPDSQLPHIVMVSVDPERDTVKRMNEYVKAFNPHFMGARADEDETEALEKQLHIVAEKMQAEGKEKKQYTINHTAEIMVFNPDGKLQAFLSYPHKAAQMVHDYKLILETMKE